jgi:hypothetical protein
MIHLYNKCKYYLDYFPLILITLFFLTETEIEKHALHTSYQIAITIITLTIFYIVTFRLKNNKLAFFLALFTWIILTIVKKKYIN